MRVRRATAADIDAVLELELGTAEAPHWGREEYVRMIAAEEGATLRRVLLVAGGYEDEREIVGFAVGKVVGAGEYAAGELESVVVAERSRRVGVGRALCAAVVAWCADGGAKRVELEVRRASAGAQALYRSLGFVEVGVRRGYYQKPADDAVLMDLSVRRVIE